MSNINVTVQDGNNVLLQVTPTEGQKVTIDRGIIGPQGPQGDPGPAGIGIPAGGTTGQVLEKASNTDYDTTWINGTISGVQLGSDLYDLSIGSGLSGTSYNGSSAVTIANTAPMVYPGAGIANSTGTAWGTSYSTTGSGNVVLANSPTISGAWGSPDSLQFNTGATVTPSVGKAWWDGGTTLNLGMTANVTGRVMEDTFYYIKASSAITKGQSVMFTGSVGSSGVITGAPASGVTDGSYIMGIAAENIALNGFGLVQYTGTLRGIDTSAFTDGAILWYNPSIAGGLTATQPVAPNVKVQMAAVINAGNGGSGSIQIRVNSGSVLGGTDSNVLFGTLANNNLIQYNSTGGYWQNVTPGSITGVGSVANAVTFNNSGIGAASGTAFNGSSAYTISYNTIGAQPAGTYVTSVGAIAPVASSGGTTPTISMAAANSTTDGYLTSTDWNTFNNKQPAGSYLTSVTADAPLSGSGTSGSHLVISQSNGTTNGYLSSTDWTTFNDKQTAYTNLTSIGNLANAPGYLYNNGSGTFSYSTPSAVTSITAGTGLTGGTITSTGTIAIDTSVVATLTDAQTLTNKAIQPRVVVITDGTSVTINADTTDMATQANTQAIGTLTINAPTGTPVNGQKVMFRLTSTNVQTFSWNSAFAGSTDLSLPTVSSGSSKTDYMGFIYNSTATKWQIIAKNFGF